MFLWYRLVSWTGWFEFRVYWDEVVRYAYLTVKATEQYFPVALFNNKVVLTFEFVKNSTMWPLSLNLQRLKHENGSNFDSVNKI